MASIQKLTDRPWRLAGTVAAVVVTTAAGGVAWATTNADPSPSPSPSTSPSTPAQPDQRGPGKGGGRHGEFGLFGGALHGEFTVAKDGGGYQTVAVQHGEVTAVSKDSITVKSDDGYTKQYTVTADTLVNAARDGIESIKTGNDVNIQGTVADGKYTAISINDSTVRQAARDKWGFQRGPR
jgi:VCBS repeat-containing protein